MGCHPRAIYFGIAKLKVSLFPTDLPHSPNHLHLDCWCNWSIFCGAGISKLIHSIIARHDEAVMGWTILWST